MRLLRGITQVVVIPSWSRIGPPDDSVDGAHALFLTGEREDLVEARDQPGSGCSGRLRLSSVAPRPTAIARCFLDAELLTDALKEGFGERVDAQAPFGSRPVGALLENAPRVRDRTTRLAASGGAEPVERPFLDGCLVQQSRAHVGVVIRAVERLRNRQFSKSRGAAARSIV